MSLIDWTSAFSKECKFREPTRPGTVASHNGRCERRSLAVGVAYVLSALLPGVVRPEGATKLLDCMVARVCDASGNCEAASGQMVFRMDPIAIEAGGAGRYTLSYGEIEVESEAMSDLGPFFWTVGRQRHALIISAETQWLWHELELGPKPEATIRFLSCSLQQ
jgi:hypothetical protein